MILRKHNKPKQSREAGLCQSEKKKINRHDLYLYLTFEGGGGSLISPIMLSILKRQKSCPLCFPKHPVKLKA